MAAFLNRAFFVLCLLASAVALILGLVCTANPHGPLLSLIDVFTLPMLTATVVMTAVFFLIRQKAAGFVGVAAALILFIALWPQAFPAERAADPSQPSVRIVFANLYVDNKRPERLLPFIAQQKPDIVATVENSPWSRTTLIPALSRDYPYTFSDGQTFVCSRFPIRNGVRDVGKSSLWYGFTLMDVATATGTMRLAVAHLAEPRPLHSTLQTQQLEDIASDLKGPDAARTVLVGDFNSDLSAWKLQKLARVLNLRPAAAPTGTWPMLLPGVLRIAIDNGFAGSRYTLSQRRVGPNFGSDHRPISLLIQAARP